MSYTPTVTVERIDPFDPDPDRIALVDIAQGLANTCRFAGQCEAFYSVAHQSLYVAWETWVVDTGARLRL